MKKISLLLLVLVFSGVLRVNATERITVYTVNYPLTYFAERIGGKYVQVVFPAPPDVDPAFWTPDSATIRNYQKADLIILNGAGYEKWTRYVSLPLSRTVDTSKAFRDELIDIKTSITHSHGPDGDHSHSGTAFTTWLDFSQAAQQAESILAALIRKAPIHKSAFEDNFRSLHKELLELDAQMTALSQKSRSLPLVGSHPIYQYMARRYSLNLEMVMWEPDVVPDESEWDNLEKLLEGHSAHWMIWEGKPVEQSAEQLENSGIGNIVFSPCFSKPAKGDFMTVMKDNIKNFEVIYR